MGKRNANAMIDESYFEELLQLTRENNQLLHRLVNELTGSYGMSREFTLNVIADFYANYLTSIGFLNGSVQD